MNQPRLAIVVSVLAALALADGCDRKEDSTAAAQAPQSAPSPAPPQTQSAPVPTAVVAAPEAAPAPMPAPAAAPAATPMAAPTVLATADGETSGVKAEITELKRNSGNTLTLKFNLMNGSDKPVALSGGDFTSGDNKFGTISGVYLLDAANKKKYLVLRDADNYCVCSNGLDNVQPNSNIKLWAKFPAPPADVQKISISIPHFSPLDDVPISQ